MPGVTSRDAILREDLSDVFLNLDKRETAFLSQLRRGENLMNVTLFSWALEGFDGRMIDGIPENKDVDVFEGDVQYRLYGRSQKFWRRPHVTVEQNTINRSPADFGKYAGQVRKKVEEQKRDIQMRALSDADSRDDDGVNGREFQAIGRYVNDTTSVGSAGVALTFTDTQTAVPAQFRTPTAQIYTGALYVTTSGAITDLTFTEDTLNGMLQSRWDALGESSDLKCFCDAIFNTHLTRIERYRKTLTGWTPTGQSQMATQASRDFLLYGAKMIETDYGNISIYLTQWLPRRSDGTMSGRAYWLDMAGMALRPSGLYLTHQQLEDKGAGPRGLIQSILGIQYGDPRAHCKVDPNVISTGT